MEKTQRKTSESNPEKFPNFSLELEDFDLNGSQSMTLPTLKREEEILRETSLYKTGYHLTVRFLRETTSRKELSLLLEVLSYQSVHFGINLNMLIAMYEIYFRLLGNKTKISDVREGRISLSLRIGEIIFQELRDQEISLGSERRFHLNSEVCQILSKGLMSKRTYGSRYRTYRPENFLKVLAVPVNALYFERRQFSHRYSSYCKGYGESHPSAHRLKSKTSSELDGDGSSWLDSEEDQLFRICTDQFHVLSNYLELAYSNWRLEKGI